MLIKHILATITYYDALDYPMTSFEIWKYLARTDDQKEQEEKDYALSEVLECLEGEGLRGRIEEDRGFYFLKGRNYLVDSRLLRNKISEEKYKIILRVVRWLRFVPYVRMIGVTGKVAMKNATGGSDLDLFVVTEKGKIFTGRTLVTFLVHILGKRRYKNKVKNRICLNYFVTNNSLEIFLKDLFASSEYSFMLPAFGFKTFQEFQSQNGWIGKYKFHFKNDTLANLKIIEDSYLSKIIRRFLEKLFSSKIIEKKLSSWQKERIQKDPRTHKAGSLVIANEEMLVFLPNPQGPKIFEKFHKSLVELTQK